MRSLLLNPFTTTTTKRSSTSLLFIIVIKIMTTTTVLFMLPTMTRGFQLFTTSSKSLTSTTTTTRLCISKRCEKGSSSGSSFSYCTWQKMIQPIRQQRPSIFDPLYFLPIQKSGISDTSQCFGFVKQQQLHRGIASTNNYNNKNHNNNNNNNNNIPTIRKGTTPEMVVKTLLSIAPESNENEMRTKKQYPNRKSTTKPNVPVVAKSSSSSVASSSQAAAVVSNNNHNIKQNEMEFKKGMKILVEIMSFGPLGATVHVVGMDTHDPMDVLPINSIPHGIGLILQREIHYFRLHRNHVDVLRGEILPAYVEMIRYDLMDIAQSTISDNNNNNDTNDNDNNNNKHNFQDELATLPRLNISLRVVGGNAKTVEAKDIVYQVLQSLPGNPQILDIGEKSTPERVNDTFPGMSKATFKKAIARLYRDRLVSFPDNYSVRLEKNVDNDNKSDER